MYIYRDVSISYTKTCRLLCDQSLLKFEFLEDKGNFLHHEPFLVLLAIIPEDFIKIHSSFWALFYKQKYEGDHRYHQVNMVRTG